MTVASQVEGLARLSNGLRTPLALIVGYADLLALAPDEQTTADAPQRIKDAAAELTRVIDDFLTVYAIEADVLRLALTPTAVAKLVDDAVVAARQRGIPIELEVDERARPALVSADPEYAVAMLSTLLENAGNRTARAGATLSVRRASRVVQFEVVDRGGSIDVEDQRQAFDLFSPLVPRTGLTTGLELYKVRRLAELHHGRVWVENGPGESQARFGLALPLARAS